MNDIVIRFITICTLIFVLFTFHYEAFASPKPRIEIRRFEQLENMEIVYHYPDFENPKIRLYNNAEFDSLIGEYDASDVTKFSVINRDIAPKEFDNTVLKDRIYTKKIFESITKERYIVSLAMMHQDNEYIYGNFKNDLLLWKENDHGFQLIAIYPESIGGCLFCGSQFNEFEVDTLSVFFSGKGNGEEWGGREFFVIQEDELYFFESERFRIFTPYNGNGNPIPGARSSVIEKYYYDKKGNLLDTKIYFNAQHGDGSPVRLFAVQDSVNLYKAKVNFHKSQLVFLKKIYPGNKPLRVGPVQGGIIPVYWDNKWYLSFRRNFHYGRFNE